ncbi:hypothetical protein ACIBX9_14690 [Streptomyces albidoflavus]|uniref:hypothetical protein n=1 Tax=Streptomyces TaxID=1883 RepID=UPI001F5C1CF9|nr:MULTISPECIES: hypothetical protein [Streptomyces]MEE1721641.1 hypothetical protein [Streptomyces sp. JV186]
MATQILTLVGVLIGALTSYFATASVERAKFRREMTTRWDERKLETYIEYVTCIKEISRAARDAGRARDEGRDPAEALWAMEASENKRSVLFETFVLLSHDAAATAAHAVNRRTRELLRAARGGAVRPGDREGGQGEVSPTRPRPPPGPPSPRRSGRIRPVRPRPG